MRASSAALVVLSLSLGLVSAAGVARADDAHAADDDFDTTWFGARLGLWYRPDMNMKVAVSGSSRTAQFISLIGTEVNIKRDLGVRGNATSDYSFENGIPEAEVFFDSRFASISLWAVAPFEYTGRTTLTRTITFGGAAFTVSQPVDSRFRQTLLGLDLRFNILNNQYVRLSPIVAIRMLGIDWEMRAGPPLNQRGTTSDINTPLEFGGFQMIPYPEIGAEVRLGLRKWFEVDAKLTGTYVDYDTTQGRSVTFEAGVTGYPIKFIGLRLGLRYTALKFESKNSTKSDSYLIDADFFGANISLIVRFG
jgi:hypothetical protein